MEPGQTAYRAYHSACRGYNSENWKAEDDSIKFLWREVEKQVLHYLGKKKEEKKMAKRVTTFKGYVGNEQTIKMAQALAEYNSFVNWDATKNDTKEFFVGMALSAQIAGGYIEPVDVIKFEKEIEERSLINTSHCENCSHSRGDHTAKGCHISKCGCSQFINPDPISCGHANENPNICPCPLDCYCRNNTCKGKTYNKQCKTCGHRNHLHRIDSEGKQFCEAGRLNSNCPCTEFISCS
jgi:hypothetical protein